MITDEQIDQGYIDLPVATLNGKKETLRLTAVDWRRQRELATAYLAEGEAQFDYAPVVESVIPTGTRLNRYPPAAQHEIITLALELVLGVESVGKLNRLTDDLLQTIREAKKLEKAKATPTSPPASAPSSPGSSSSTGSPPPATTKPERGATKSSNSTPASSKPKRRAKPSA